MANKQNWLFKDFCIIFEEKTGTQPNHEEKLYISKFFDINIQSKGKEIYYLSVFRLKRCYPKVFVYYLILWRYKQYFKRTNAPKSLCLLASDFAKYTLNQAIKAYCRLGD